MSWALAEKISQAGQYVSGLDGGQPTWTTDLEQAVWASKASTVDLWIQHNNISDAKAKTQGGNHPGTKPALP